ncbi:acetyl-coenzyme A synthetase [Cyclospora cayetanensis]|uniref:Acetyl-coenzyme A synthetase n=1 Tax=Cyclospora cayetanensis TaxID=88456 RepID=A0A6P6S182_9EIME|nr:acetyl-coenzyme A synthetase [Cyclospora cayetanensis]
MPAAWDRDLGEACVVDRGSPNVERSDLNLEGAHEAISSFPVKEVHEPPPKNTSRCNVPSESMYKHLYWRSLTDADNFWREKALEKLRWSHPFTKTQHGSLKNGDMSWFLNGKLNVCDNCVDRWAEQYPQRIALIYEGDTSKDSQVVTYKELQDQVCRFANLLKSLDVRKGDIVTIYLPMMPEIVYAMLACARIGAVHSVVFAGLSANSLAERLEDANSRVLITATKSTRGGREVHLKKVVDEALEHVSCVKHVVLFRKSEDPSSFVEGRDLSGDDLLPQMRPYCPLEIMDSEDLLFILYTSGSTGKPKGVCHTIAGYLLYAALTHEYIFDYHPGDTFGCLADCGWITGHSYTVYGPLCNGATTVLFQGIPTYPHPGRYWDLVQKWRITQLYTSPTAIRALMQHGDEWPKKYDLSTLRVIGSVGEPINPEAWRWYYENIGKGQCSVVDTYWQTETGGHVLAPFPGATITKPGCAMVPFFGIEPAIVDPQTGEEKKGNEVCGVLCLKRPWPGMCRTVHRAHKRLVNTYLQPYPGYYFTGDGAYRDADGHYWITGRVDDTLNVSGHRLSTAEIEHALVQHPRIVEAAVVGVPHEVKGTAIFCFVILKAGETPAGVIDEARKQVRKEIGPIATPDFIVIAPGLPKTQSGKIMRRLLRKLCCLDQSLGDTTSLANAEVIPSLQGLIMETVLAERKTPTTTAAEKAATSGKKAKHNSS